MKWGLKGRLESELTAEECFYHSAVTTHMHITGVQFLGLVFLLYLPTISIHSGFFGSKMQEAIGGCNQQPASSQCPIPGTIGK